MPKTSYPKRGENRRGTSYDEGKTYKREGRENLTPSGGMAGRASRALAGRGQRIDAAVSWGDGSKADVRRK